MTDPLPKLDLRAPRSLAQIVGLALRVFARRPLLFMFVAALAVVPYAVVTVLVTNSGHVSTGTELIIALAGIAIVNPFVAAMQMQALIDLGEGRRPRTLDVLSRGTRVLPMVVAADIIAGIPEFLGLIYVLFVIPGLLAAVRLAVAAPVAAAERVAWPDAIRRSLRLTRGNSWRVFGLLMVQAVATLAVATLVGAGARGAQVVGVVLAVLAQSFFTLMINLLYFDLRARAAAPVA